MRNTFSTLYSLLPESLQPAAKRIYYGYQREPSPESVKSEFISNHFDSKAEYQSFVEEVQSSDIEEIIREAENKYKAMVPEGRMGTVRFEAGVRYYALVRKYKPEIIVETGVLNGGSTLFLLAALEKNDSGKLWSIDYPYHFDEDINDFKSDTYDDFGGASLPPDKEPGWLIPDTYRNRWELIIGKSQRELPELFAEIEDIDMFIHDSEHSIPCMLFEFEIAWEWLKSDGILLADDIAWNEAFQIFTNNKDCKSGLVVGQNPKNGYIVK